MLHLIFILSSPIAIDIIYKNMSSKSCHHIHNFKKKSSQLDTLKWIHAVFVVSDNPKSRKAKVRLNFYYIPIILMEAI